MYLDTQQFVHSLVKTEYCIPQNIRQITQNEIQNVPPSLINYFYHQFPSFLREWPEAALISSQVPDTLFPDHTYKGILVHQECQLVRGEGEGSTPNTYGIRRVAWKHYPRGREELGRDGATEAVAGNKGDYRPPSYRVPHSQSCGTTALLKTRTLRPPKDGVAGIGSEEFPVTPMQHPAGQYQIQALTSVVYICFQSCILS